MVQEQSYQSLTTKNNFKDRIRNKLTRKATIILIALFAFLVLYIVIFSLLTRSIQKFTYETVGGKSVGPLDELLVLDENRQVISLLENDSLKILTAEGYTNRWSAAVVRLFTEQLGLPQCADETSNFVISYPKALLSSFPGENIYDFLWEYVSLTAIADLNADVAPAITNVTYESLTKMLKSVKMPVLNSINRSSFDLSFAKILGNTTPVHIEDAQQLLQRAPLFIEAGAKRYIDVIDMGLPNVKELFSFDDALILEANQQLENIRDSFNLSQSVLYLGVKIVEIEDSKVPANFYTDALDVLHKEYHFTEYVFVVICTANLTEYCERTFASHSKTSITFVSPSISAKDELNHFMQLSQCNSTMVINTSSALHALIKGTPAVVYIPKLFVKQEYSIPFRMSNHISHWYQIKE